MRWIALSLAVLCGLLSMALYFRQVEANGYHAMLSQSIEERNLLRWQLIDEKAVTARKTAEFNQAVGYFRSCQDSFYEMKSAFDAMIGLASRKLR